MKPVNDPLYHFKRSQLYCRLNYISLIVLILITKIPGIENYISEITAWVIEGILFLAYCFTTAAGIWHTVLSYKLKEQANYSRVYYLVGHILLVMIILLLVYLIVESFYYY